MESSEQIDEGSESQEEEMLLKWEEEDEENVELKYDENTLDEDALLAIDTEHKKIITQITSKVNEKIDNILIDNHENKEILLELTKASEESSTQSSSIGNKMEILRNLGGIDTIIGENVKKIEINNDKLEVKQISMLQTHTKSVKEQENVPNIAQNRELSEIDGINNVNQNVINLIPHGSINSKETKLSNTFSETKINESNTHTTIIGDISPDNTDMDNSDQNINVNEEELDETNRSNKTTDVETSLNCGIPESLNKIETPGQSAKNKTIPNILTEKHCKHSTNIDMNLGESKLESLTDNNTKVKTTDSLNNTVMTKVDSLNTFNVNFCSTPEIKRDHAINKPNIMLEIPTQELIDIDNDSVLEEHILSQLESPVSKNVNDDFYGNDDSQIPSTPTENVSVNNIILRLEGKDNVEKSHKDILLLCSGSEEETDKQNKTLVKHNEEISKNNEVIPNKSNEVKNLKNLSKIEVLSPEINIYKKSSEIAPQNENENVGIDNKQTKYYYYYEDTDAQSDDIYANNKHEDQKCLEQRNISGAHVAYSNTDTSNKFEKEASLKQKCPDELKGDSKKSVAINKDVPNPAENKPQTNISHKQQTIELKDMECTIKKCEKDKAMEREMLTKQTMKIATSTGTMTEDNTVLNIISCNENESSNNTSKTSTTEATSAKHIPPSKTIPSVPESFTVSKTMPVTGELSQSVSAIVSQEDTSPSDTTPIPLESTLTVSEAILSIDTLSDFKAIPTATKAILSTLETAPSILDIMPLDPEVISSTSKTIIPNLEAMSPIMEPTETLSSALQYIPTTTDGVPVAMLATLSTSETIPAETTVLFSKDVGPTFEVITSIQTVKQGALEVTPPDLKATILPSILEATSTTKDIPLALEAIPSTSEITTPTTTSTSKEIPLILQALPSALDDRLLSTEAITLAVDIIPATEVTTSTLKALSGASEVIPSELLAKPSTSKATLLISEVIPSTSVIIPSILEDRSLTSDAVPSTSEASLLQPSSSKLDDVIDQNLEIEDDLGLLAETSRVMDDDEEMEDEECDDDDDQDIDDESSILMTAEHSEDSNAPNSENEQSDTPAVTAEKEDIQTEESSNQLDQNPEESMMNLEDKLKGDSKSTEDVIEKEKNQVDNVTAVECDDIDITEVITVEEPMPVEELVATKELPDASENVSFVLILLKYSK